ncbi:Membrane-bound lytic murein transglycosylase D precursor [hydrothermal vent metagenome]|uniref:Membrane-bound lytic murein transglycosylase D n=1 Tax=hydrothermal vent metagenome TaxID=652676 RepID=A0A3B0V722_9ZZZZ
MKKIILTLVSSAALIACQTTNTKRNVAINIEHESQQVNAEDVLKSLNQCQQEHACKIVLDSQFNSWLIEKNYITIEQHVETDEHDNLGVAKIVTGQNQPLPKITLSSDYMNNQLVKGAINEWLTWKRPQLINTWQYYQFLRKDLLAFEQYNIPEAFILAIIAQESAGKVHARSRAGAGGLFQIMPATAKRLGLRGEIGAYDLRFDPAQSAQAAAKYIHEQWQLYDGDKVKILAAYNSGENRFARLNKRYKNKSLWDKNFYYELPRETRHYIPVVIAAMLIFQDPQKFNVVLAPFNTETMIVNLPNKTSLSELAVCLGQEQRADGWFRILRNLNASIKADTIIKANTDLKIPKTLATIFATSCHHKELMQLARSLHESDFQATGGLFNYRVKQGDSLNKIARKFRCSSRKEIAQLNNLKAPRYLIRAGKHLKVPQC